MAGHSSAPPQTQLPAWGHASGTLLLQGGEVSDSLQSVANRIKITERIARYCWAYDERRVELLADCFTEDAVWEGNVLGHIPIGPFQGRDRLIKWLTGFWPYQHDQRRHMLLNTIVENLTADTALTLSYMLLMSSNAREVSVETSGFYRVTYRRDAENWRIDRLTGGFDAPFWPGEIDRMSPGGRARHGVAPKIQDPDSPTVIGQVDQQIQQIQQQETKP